ncbi:MAG: PP0621 family protein [Bacillota bacterium]
MKLLFWALVVLAVLWLLRGKKTAGSPAAAGAARNNGTETMVQCAHCGVHVPASESILAASGAAYCTEEHRLRHAS